MQNLSPQATRRIASLVGGSLLLAISLNKSVFSIEGGEKGIVFNRISGLRSTAFSEGLHFCIPGFEWPIVFDIRAKPYLTASLTGTKDLQSVNISLRVLYRPKQESLQKIYREVGSDFARRILPSICNEVLKSIVARYNASELITLRSKVSREIYDELAKRAADFHIILEDVAITELTFSPKFSQAVEAKQIALQEAQRAEFTVQKAQQEKQRKIVVAEGEAESAELIGKAISTNPMYLKLRKIEVSKKIAKTLAKSNNTVYLDSESLVIGETNRLTSQQQQS
ncbi:MAG: Prohibitin-2, subunit of the prohibitin complex (Phb1p-Phb2p) [Marteilia pararefringens]